MYVVYLVAQHALPALPFPFFGLQKIYFNFRNFVQISPKGSILDMQYRTSNDFTIIQQHAVMYIPIDAAPRPIHRWKKPGNTYVLPASVRYTF